MIIIFPPAPDLLVLAAWVLLIGGSLILIASNVIEWYAARANQPKRPKPTPAPRKRMSRRDVIISVGMFVALYTFIAFIFVNSK